MKATLTAFLRGAACVTAMGMAGSSFASAGVTTKTMCAFDPIGANGPIYQAFLDYQAVAMKWGVKINLKPYTDERVAAEDFKSGVCDLVNVTGLRARSFNSFSGTMDSIGAIPTYKHLKTVLDTLATPKAAKYMISGDYETVGIIPGGAIFPFVTDKNINSPEKLAGRKIAVLDNAPEMQILVAQAGMTPVGSTLANVFSKFNNHTVEIAGGPALVFEPMELHKGMDPNGGIINYPMLQLTIQVISRTAQLPSGFGQKSREYTNANFDTAMKMILDSEARIPKKYWIEVNAANEGDWAEIFRQNRIVLRDKGIYNGKALTLFRKIRCKMDASRAECSADDKE